MSTLAIKQGRPHHGADTFHVVLRRHDLSGTDYEPLIHVDRTLAIALGAKGLVVRESDAVHGSGRPGVVLEAGDGEIAEIRADVADPTTVMTTFEIDRGLSREVLGDQAIVDLRWVGVPPEI